MAEANFGNRKPNHIVFNVVRQYTVAPDQRYRVYLQRDCLYFQLTGSQFDQNWLLKGLKEGAASKALPHWIRHPLLRLAQGSRQTLLLTGAGIVAGSLLLLIMMAAGAPSANANPLLRAKFTRQFLVVFPVLFMVLISGCVFLIAGFCAVDVSSKPGKGKIKGFRLPLTKITKAKFIRGEGGFQAKYRAGGGQVASLELRPTTGKTVFLAIPTDDDLAMVEENVISRLGNKVTSG